MLSLTTSRTVTSRRAAFALDLQVDEAQIRGEVGAAGSGRLEVLVGRRGKVREGPRRIGRQVFGGHAPEQDGTKVGGIVRASLQHRDGLALSARCRWLAFPASCA